MTYLVSGCSFTNGHEWPVAMFPDASITNRGRSGAGNAYIGRSIVNAIDLKHPPKHVFILWSGINRFDCTIPVTNLDNALAEEFHYHGTVDSAHYLFSGGNNFNNRFKDNYQRIADPTWPTVTTVDDYLALPADSQQELIDNDLFEFKNNTPLGMVQNYIMLQYQHNPEYFEDLSYQNIMLCQTFLEHHGIPYNFSFIADPFDRGNYKQMGTLTKNHSLYHCINWEKYVKLTPYEYGVRHNLLSYDSFHLTKDGMCQWATEVKQILTRKQ